jgi:zinc-ribbon domain
MTNVKGFSAVFCSKCGMKIPEESTFCTRCGEKIRHASGISNKMLILACCAAALSLSVAALSFFRDPLMSGINRNLSNSANPSTSPAPSAPSAPSASTTPKGSPTLPVVVVETAKSPQPSPTPTDLSRAPVSEKIVANSLRLGRRQFRPYRFVIDDNLQNPRITGRVSVEGGGENDIEIIVADDQGLQEFSSRKTRFSNQYRGMVINNSNVFIPISRPGTYYLILSNRHAYFYAKRVKADLSLEYE